MADSRAGSLKEGGRVSLPGGDRPRRRWEDRRSGLGLTDIADALFQGHPFQFLQRKGEEEIDSAREGLERLLERPAPGRQGGRLARKSSRAAMRSFLVLEIRDAVLSQAFCRAFFEGLVLLSRILPNCLDSSAADCR